MLNTNWNFLLLVPPPDFIYSYSCGIGLLQSRQLSLFSLELDIISLLSIFSGSSLFITHYILKSQLLRNSSFCRTSSASYSKSRDFSNNEKWKVKFRNIHHSFPIELLFKTTWQHLKSMLKKISSQAKTRVHYSKCSKYFEETPPHNNLHCLLIVFMNARKQRIVLWTKNDSNSFIEMSDSSPYNIEQWNDSSREENFRGRKGPELSWT